MHAQGGGFSGHALFGDHIGAVGLSAHGTAKANPQYRSLR